MLIIWPCLWNSLLPVWASLHSVDHLHRLVQLAAAHPSRYGDDHLGLLVQLAVARLRFHGDDDLGLLVQHGAARLSDMIIWVCLSNLPLPVRAFTVMTI